MKNILSVNAQKRTTQSRLLYPSAVRPEQTSPPVRPKQTAALERRAPIFLEQADFWGFHYN